MRAGWGAGRGVDGVTTNLLQFTDTKKKEESKGGVVRRRRRRESDTTMPAILFLSSAATAFVAMTTQADDLIAVTFECCSLKEPATQNRKQTGSTHTHTHARTRTACSTDTRCSCSDAEKWRSFNFAYKTRVHILRKKHES